MGLSIKNVVRCPVRIIDKYMSLLPPVREHRKANFYLRSLEWFTPAQWYGEQAVGLNTLRKIMTDITKRGNLEGFFTNHSLRRSRTTRLFQAGVDRKLIKEFMGHRSDAVDAYQVTLDTQRQMLSEVIAGDPTPALTSKKGEGDICQLKFSVGESCDRSGLACSCTRKAMKVSNLSELGKMIENIIRKKEGSRATITLKVDFDC